MLGINFEDPMNISFLCDDVLLIKKRRLAIDFEFEDPMNVIMSCVMMCC